MLHTCLIVHNHIRVMGIQSGKLCLKKSVYVAVTSFSLGSSHHKQVEVIIFHQCAVELELRVIRFAHSCRDRVVLCHFRAGDLLADISEGCVHFHAEHLVQIGICICVYCKNRSFALLAQILDQHTAKGCLTYAAFSCNRYYMCHKSDAS